MSSLRVNIAPRVTCPPEPIGPNNCGPCIYVSPSRNGRVEHCRAPPNNTFIRAPLNADIATLMAGLREQNLNPISVDAQTRLPQSPNSRSKRGGTRYATTPIGRSADGTYSREAVSAAVASAAAYANQRARAYQQYAAGQAGQAGGAASPPAGAGQGGSPLARTYATAGSPSVAFLSALTGLPDTARQRFIGLLRSGQDESTIISAINRVKSRAGRPVAAPAAAVEEMVSRAASTAGVPESKASEAVAAIVASNPAAAATMVDLATGNSRESKVASDAVAMVASSADIPTAAAAVAEALAQDSKRTSAARRAPSGGSAEEAGTTRGSARRRLEGPSGDMSGTMALRPPSGGVAGPEYSLTPGAAEAFAPFRPFGGFGTAAARAATAPARPALLTPAAFAPGGQFAVAPRAPSGASSGGGAAGRGSSSSGDNQMVPAGASGYDRWGDDYWRDGEDEDYEQDEDYGDDVDQDFIQKLLYSLRQ